jgi:hypothetical protein
MDWHGADGSAPTNPVQGNAARLDHHFRSLIQEAPTETRWCPSNRATLIQRMVNVADPPTPPDFAVIVAVPVFESRSQSARADRSRRPMLSSNSTTLST